MNASGNVIEKKIELDALNEENFFKIFFKLETHYSDFKFRDGSGKSFEKKDGIKFEIMMFEIVKSLLDNGFYEASDLETGCRISFKIVNK